MITSPQDHWMIKGSGFEIGRGKERQEEFLTNQERFVWRSGSFLERDRKSVKSRAHNVVGGEGKTVKRWFGECGVSVCEVVGGWVRPSVNVKLVFEVVEETRRLAGESAGGREGEMRGHQKIRDVSRVDFTSDSSVVAGRAGVFENSASIGRDPNETEDGSVESRGGGTQVVDRQVGFGDLGD